MSVRLARLRENNISKGELSPFRCRILFLEDNPYDVELILHELSEAGLDNEYVRVDRKDQFIEMVRQFRPDVILADYSLAQFNGIEAFNMLKAERLNTAFILVTGVLSEQMALACLKDGIDDFVLKSNFKRLPQAIISAIGKKTNEREKSKMAAELEKSHKELRLLVNRQQQSVEEERLSIARDLHDELGQVLTALKIDLTMLWKKIRSGKVSGEQPIDQEFNGVINLIDKITRSVKDISAGLRPDTLDELGFVESVQGQAVEFERRSKIRCRTSLPLQSIDLDKNVSIALFRIVQEALTNVARHSQASVVEIKVNVADDMLAMSITDNGKGISEADVTNTKSVGIIGMRERVRLLQGEFSSGKAVGRGTRVSVAIPLKSREP